MLEEALQRLADGETLGRGQQVLQLLRERPSLDLDARGENLCNPLQGGEGRGAARGLSRVRVCKKKYSTFPWFLWRAVEQFECHWLWALKWVMLDGVWTNLV